MVNLFKVISNRKLRFNYMTRLGFYNKMSDEEYLKKKYKIFMGEELNLDNPKLFTEKIQWLKLYNRNPEYTTIVDKHTVKEWVSEKIGSKYIVPEYGVWDRAEDIDYSKLPDEFVLKVTHDSGGFVVCTNKNKIDKKKIESKLNKSLKQNYYYSGREWAYRDVKPRIIAEKYIPSLGKKDSVEYKLTCFDGKVGLITICTGIPHSSFSVRFNDNYDRDFNYLPFYAYYHNTHPIEKPREMDEIIRLSEILSKDIPQVRVDWYVDNGNIYFGEMTFYTWGGIIKFSPDEWNKKLGDMIDLSKVKKYEN